MSEEKKQRITSAVISGIVMLLCIVIAITVYQLVGIIQRKNKIEKLNQEIAYLESQLDETNEQIEIWSQEWKIKERARELGLQDTYE